MGGQEGDCSPALTARVYRAAAATDHRLLLATDLPKEDRACATTTLARLYAASPRSAANSTNAIVDECYRRLRAHNDSGDSDLDRNLAPRVRIRRLTSETTGFKRWWRRNAVSTAGAAPGGRGGGGGGGGGGGSGGAHEQATWRHYEQRGVAEWVVPDAMVSDAYRIVFLHGGAYSYYSPSDGYRPLTTRLAAATKLPLLAIDYRKAPEHSPPDAVKDAAAALRWAWANGPSGRRSAAKAVFLLGDSAGGGLVLSLLVALRLGESSTGLRDLASHRPPTAAATLSAWTDLTCSLGTYTTRTWVSAWWDATGTAAAAARGRGRSGGDMGGEPNEPRESHGGEVLPQEQPGDPVFSTGDPTQDVADSLIGARRYHRDGDARDPRVSPLFAPSAVLAALPPLLMLVGDAELMLADSTEFAARTVEAVADRDAAKHQPTTANTANTANTAPAPTPAATPSVRLRIYPRMWHVWPMYAEACGQGWPLPPAERAFDELATFFREHAAATHGRGGYGDFENVKPR